MIKIECPYCGSSCEVQVPEKRLGKVQKADSMNEPTDTIVCRNKHIFYCILET